MKKQKGLTAIQWQRLYQWLRENESKVHGSTLESVFQASRKSAPGWTLKPKACSPDQACLIEAMKQCEIYSRDFFSVLQSIEKAGK